MIHDLSLKHLIVHQFRPFKKHEVSFDPKVNVIVGDNAKGKTSLLEAIYLLVAGTSFRTARLHELILHGSDQLAVDVAYTMRSIERRLRVVFGEKGKRVISDQTSFAHLHAVVGILPGVVMVPSDLGLIKGAPQLRREFLDRLISQSDPLYFHHLKRFQRTLKQRNRLLKLRQLKSIESWENEMAQSAAYLTAKRQEVLVALEKAALEIYPMLGEAKETLSLHFLLSFPITDEDLAASYRSQFHRLREKECLLGTTLVGPHKEDFAVYLANKEARYFASEGQQRSIVAALKLSEWQIVAEKTREKPLMLIDDFGQSLDPKRQERFVHLLTQLGQVILTTNSKPKAAAHVISL